jgi:hypothetical protein
MGCGSSSELPKRSDLKSESKDVKYTKNEMTSESKDNKRVAKSVTPIKTENKRIENERGESITDVRVRVGVRVREMI